MPSTQARVQGNARAAGARERAQFDGARGAPGRERPRAALLPIFRCSDVPLSWATGRNIGISTPWPIRGGALGSPGPDSCPHGPRRAKLSASDRNIALRMRSAWRYGAIHGEAAPDYGTTSSRRFPTAARQCSHPQLGANAPRVRHQSGISMPGELAATACGKARAQAAMRPPESWRADTRRLVRLGSDASSPATPPRNRNSGARTTNVPTYRRDQGPQVGTHDTDKNPSNTTRQRLGANLTMHVQQRSKSESRETATMCVYNR